MAELEVGQTALRASRPEGRLGWLFVAESAEIGVCCAKRLKLRSDSGVRSEVSRADGTTIRADAGCARSRDHCSRLGGSASHGSPREPRPSQDGILDRGFTEGAVMPRIRIAFGALLLLAVSSCTPPAASAQNLTCGLKPIPALGCRIGRCGNGAWEQICDSNPGLSCGLKPIPAVGCRVGRCVDGGWEQICDQSPGLSCGLKPIPAVGCRIGRCVDGAWEQVCD